MGHSCAFMMVTPLCSVPSPGRPPYAPRTGVLIAYGGAYGLGFKVGFGVVCFGCGVGSCSGLGVVFGLPLGV